MNIAGLIFLLTAHYLSGRGLLRLFKIELNPVPAFCVSMITGVPLISFAPCILQLFNIPIATIPVITAVVILTVIFSIPVLKNFKAPRFKKPALPVYYEWPFLLACTFLMLLAAWRSFYYPPYARDMLAGPELLAEFAVREHTMISSVFTLDLQSNNNYFKSPFITCLQILYKLLVCQFGQVWLNVVAIPFWIWLYSILRSRIHPLIAGFLLFFFMTMPEVYAYSYVMLYDYCNMVFFFAGFYFLIRFMENANHSNFLFSAILFGLAAYIRTETLLLVAMIMPMLVVYLYRNHYNFPKMAIRIFLFFAIPAVFYFLCIHVFIRLFVPIPFDLSNQVKPDTNNIVFFLTRIKDMTLYLIFSKEGIHLFGYFIFFFCALLPIDLIVFRKFNRESRIALYGILVVYLGMPLLGYLIPLVDLENTTKRGMFKFLPLMLLYMSNSSCLQYLSNKIRNWEIVNLKPRDAE